MDACSEAMAAMAVKPERCTHCGTQGAEKRCSICQQAFYCGAECQKAVVQKVEAANIAMDSRKVLKWEGRLSEMMAMATEDDCLSYLAFSRWRTRWDKHPEHPRSRKHIIVRLRNSASNSWASWGFPGTRARQYAKLAAHSLTKAGSKNPVRTSSVHATSVLRTVSSL